MDLIEVIVHAQATNGLTLTKYLCDLAVTSYSLPHSQFYALTVYHIIETPSMSSRLYITFYSLLECHTRQCVCVPMSIVSCMHKKEGLISHGNMNQNYCEEAPTGGIGGNIHKLRLNHHRRCT